MTNDSLSNEKKSVILHMQTARSGLPSIYLKSKKMKNFFLKGFALIALATCVLAGCSRSLESVVEEMNEELPKQVSDGQTLTKIAIEGEYLVFYAADDESEFQFDDYRFRREVKKIEKDPNLRKRMMSGLFDSNDEFAKLLKKEKKGVKMVLSGKKSGETISFTLANPGEI